MNTFKTAFLLTALTLVLLFLGQHFGGQNGMVAALVIAAVMNFVSYFFSDKIALAMYRAQPVTREDLPRVYGVVERLTQRVGIPIDRKSTRLNSSHITISYAVFCLKKKKPMPTALV